MEFLFRLFDNPVLHRELRSSFRRRRTFLVLFSLLLLLSILIPILYSSFTNRSMTQDTEFAGTVTFVTLVMIEATLILFLTPAMTSTGFTVEKEQRTFDLLISTRLSPWEIVLGKLMASLYWVFLFILCSAPILFLTIFFGGISPNDILLAFLYLAFLALVYAILGLFVSLIVKRTVAAVSLVLFFVLLINAGPLLVLLLAQLLELDPDPGAFFVCAASAPYLPLAEILFVDVRKDLSRHLFAPMVLINVFLLGNLALAMYISMIRRVTKISQGDSD